MRLTGPSFLLNPADSTISRAIMLAWNISGAPRPVTSLSPITNFSAALGGEGEGEGREEEKRRECGYRRNETF
jgi:hypothetical protein